MSEGCENIGRPECLDKKVDDERLMYVFGTSHRFSEKYKKLVSSEILDESTIKFYEYQTELIRQILDLQEKQDKPLNNLFVYDSVSPAEEVCKPLVPEPKIRKKISKKSKVKGRSWSDIEKSIMTSGLGKNEDDKDENYRI